MFLRQTRRVVSAEIKKTERKKIPFCPPRFRAELIDDSGSKSLLATSHTPRHIAARATKQTEHAVGRDETSVKYDVETPPRSTPEEDESHHVCTRFVVGFYVEPGRGEYETRLACAKTRS